MQCVDLVSAGKTDLSAFRLMAWTSNPSKITKVFKLFIADHAPVLAGNLPPYLRENNMLQYCVIVHIWSKTDFNPADPSPSPSPPTSDDRDSGHDGNLDRHHFSQGSAPRTTGFQCTRRVVDGEVRGAGNGYPAVHTRGHRDVTRQASAAPKPTLKQKQKWVVRKALED